MNEMNDPLAERFAAIEVLVQETFNGTRDFVVALIQAFLAVDRAAAKTLMDEIANDRAHRNNRAVNIVSMMTTVCTLLAYRHGCDQLAVASPEHSAFSCEVGIATAVLADPGIIAQINGAVLFRALPALAAAAAAACRIIDPADPESVCRDLLTMTLESTAAEYLAALKPQEGGTT